MAETKETKKPTTTKKAASGVLYCIAGGTTDFASVVPGEFVYADSKIAKALPDNFVPVEDKIRDFSKDR